MESKFIFFLTYLFTLVFTDFDFFKTIFNDNTDGYTYTVDAPIVNVEEYLQLDTLKKQEFTKDKVKIDRIVIPKFSNGELKEAASEYLILIKQYLDSIRDGDVHKLELLFPQMENLNNKVNDLIVNGSEEDLNAWLAFATQIQEYLTDALTK